MLTTVSVSLDAGGSAVMAQTTDSNYHNSDSYNCAQRYNNKQHLHVLDKCELTR